MKTPRKRGQRRFIPKNMKFFPEDEKDLRECRRRLGADSDVGTIRLLMRLFLGKIPGFPPVRIPEHLKPPTENP